MPVNLEVKAFIPSVVGAARVADRLHARRLSVFHQVDTYFRVPRGRLKLRRMSDGSSELIFYIRPNTTGVRYSDYVVLPVSSPGFTLKILRRLFDEVVEVRKRRLLYRYRNARIHLDTVEKLGRFVEFEVEVQKGKVQAQRLMSFLRKQFGITRKNMIGSSYSDLLLKRKARGQFTRFTSSIRRRGGRRL